MPQPRVVTMGGHASKMGGGLMRPAIMNMANPFAMRREAKVLETKATAATMKVVTYGGAASKLLPETVKEENEEDKGSPLLNDND